MQQEVSKIEKISNKDFIEHKIFEEADAYEHEYEDPFFKRQKRFVDPSLSRPFVKPKAVVIKADNSKPYEKKAGPGKFHVHGNNVLKVNNVVKKTVISQPSPRVKANSSQRPVQVVQEKFIS
ncbi:hypothetical protein L1987_32449 [Smallanthus sonchifolius]|uniref:Uncharacterized protein n=1 Tax=Smallanthus sonchifolius TaxID=185202 RepID=A0ACB9HPZ8_9ASTR|nr:hypothetical protein L1987_32449 [Smallanthus sonchifolius]